MSSEFFAFEIIFYFRRNFSIMTTATTLHAPRQQALQSAVRLQGPMLPGFEQILTPEALAFVVALQRKFNHTRKVLLLERDRLQQRIDQGWKPGFLPETKHIRESAGQVEPVPADLQDRRV